MLSEFLQKKAMFQFNIFDTDDNGYIELADYTRYIDELVKAGAIQGDGYRQMQAETVAQWNQIREHADTNRDARVSADEWMAWQTALYASAQQGGGAFPFEKYAHVLCDILDLDNDGKITVDEYRNVVAAYGLQNVDVEGNFARFDTNGDGHLSREEVVKVIAEFWFSEDPSASANYIYGAF